MEADGFSMESRRLFMDCSCFVRVAGKFHEAFHIEFHGVPIENFTCLFPMEISWGNNFGQVVHTYVPLSPSSIT